MRRLRKERKKLEKEAAESKEDSWFVLHETSEALKWKADIFGPDHYAVNPVAEDEAKGVQRKSPYAGGRFPVVLEFKASYPMTPPKVYFGCPVYHPQVKLSGADAGHLCADFVSAGWKPSETVRGVLEKLRTILAAPTTDGSLEAEVSSQFQKDIEAFEKQAASYVDKYCT